MSVTTHKSVSFQHKVHTYIEYHSVSPCVGIGTPHPLFRKRVCPSPRNQRGWAHSPAGEGVVESQFQRQEKNLSTLSTLCISDPDDRGGAETKPKSVGPLQVPYLTLHYFNLYSLTFYLIKNIKSVI
jgi:hypothetical protein